MKYPISKDEATKALQGIWKTKDGNKQFEIKGNIVINPIGIKDNFNTDILNDMDYDLRFNETDKLWQIACGSVFGHDYASISEWDENSFSTSISPVVLGTFDVSTMDSLLRPVKTKFIRLT